MEIRDAVRLINNYKSSGVSEYPNDHVLNSAFTFLRLMNIANVKSVNARILDTGGIALYSNIGKRALISIIIFNLSQYNSYCYYHKGECIYRGHKFSDLIEIVSKEFEKKELLSGH